MTEQLTEITVGFAPEVETSTSHWVVAEEYEKLQARIEVLEDELKQEKFMHETLAFLLDLSNEINRMHFRNAAIGQCTPSRNRTTGWRRLLGL